MKKEKLLIFIVAYNHEKTIKNVIDRIPKNLKNLYILEILIIDDNSKDNTFEISKKIKKDHKKKNIFNINIFYNPVNQGYGGNQKLGYHYAIKKNFKYVVLLHGDGQYAPEVLPKLLNQTLKNNVVMGSRMINKKLALKGGMPVYKFIGNIILTRLQNFLLGTGLAEFHTGYRIYLVKSLKKIPFYLNTNDFHFDTEILIQLVINKDSIKEISIPTFYGDEICHVNGTKYAFNVLRMTLTAKIQKISKLVLTEKFNIKKKTKNYLFSYKRVDNLLKLSMKRK